MSQMTPAQRDYIASLSQRLHGTRSGAFMDQLRASFPDPTQGQASRWITSLKEQATSDKPKAVVFDYDGTLCDVRGIRHYVRNPDRKKRDYDAFHRSSNFCPPNPQVAAQARSAHEAGFVVIGVTARMEKYRMVTTDWNAKHGIHVDHLLMRADDDFRVDYEVKRDILARLRERYNVVHATDDNPAVIRLWNEEGIETSLVPGFDHAGDRTDVLEVPNVFEGMSATQPVPAKGTVNRDPLPEVPEGRYAVPTEVGALGFYRVQRPTSGKWAGRTFVSVMASDAEHPVRGAAARSVLAKIAVDPRGAMECFGREIGTCGRCGRVLTDDASRTRGIGPDCATKMG